MKYIYAIKCSTKKNGGGRIFGFYWNFSWAVEALEHNTCDMYECCYGYAKILQIDIENPLNKVNEFDFTYNKEKDGFFADNVLPEIEDSDILYDTEIYTCIAFEHLKEKMGWADFGTESDVYYCETKELAYETLKETMKNTNFKYAMIEKVSPGIHSICLKENRILLEQNDELIQIDEPEILNNLCNITIG